MAKKVKIGLIGLGKHIRRHHIPYLQNREVDKGDVEIAWITGYLPEDSKIADSYDINKAESDKDKQRYKCVPGEKWKDLIENDKVDGVIVSLPSSLHAVPARNALQYGVNVAVEKPPTITVRECSELVDYAEKNDLVFVTISQRRYENVYQKVKEIIENNGLGEPQLINYLIAHEYFEDEKWPHSKQMAGGGILIASGYHGIDTILWLLSHCPNYTEPIRVKSVSARWLLDPWENREIEDCIEIVTAVRISLDNGCIFNVIASCANPKGSLDENFKIYGTNGAIRIMRDRFKRSDSRAACLSYQNKTGEVDEIDTSNWWGKESAPVEDFVNAILAKKNGQSWTVLSPTKESIKTLRVIEAAYESAEQNGKEISLCGKEQTSKLRMVQTIHHIAIQTNDIDKSIHFYKEILGAELLEKKRFKKRHMAWLKVGEVKLEVFSKRKGEILEKWNDFYSGPVHVAFSVHDIDAFLENAVKNGAQFHPSHPQPFVPPVPGANKIAYLLGPDGEEVEIRGISDLT